MYDITMRDARQSNGGVMGEIDGGFVFSAKVYDIGSHFGIDNGRVSKLDIRNNGKIIVGYDRGWGIKPETAEDIAVYNAVMERLENLSKIHALDNAGEEILPAKPGENAAEVNQTFEVTITETLKLMVEIEAASRDEAEQIVGDNWRESGYLLDTYNFVGVEFEAVPVERERSVDTNVNLQGGNHDMNGDSNNALQSETAAPLAENEYVKELFSILQENGRDTSGLAALLGHVEGMESFVKRAEDRIADMKSQLADMKEVQNHPVKTALQNAIKTLEHKVAEVKEQLGELKTNIVEGCKNAVTAFKEKGATALDKLASFFHIKGALKALDKSVTQSAATCDKAVANISRFSREYHSAGSAIKNMGRMLAGKEPIDAKKEAGKLAKTLSAPYKAEKAVLLKISGLATAMVNRLDNLENAAEARQASRAREKKPSMLGELHENLQLLAQEKLNMPVQERAKTKAAEL